MSRTPFHLLLIATLLGGLLALATACGGEAPPMGSAVTGRDSLPVMVTRGVSKLISDSGVIRYKVIAEEWRIFDKTTPPRWEFPKGIFIERYDDKFKVNLYLTADSAWIYDQNLCKLRGHVVLDNREDQTLLTTEELFWDIRSNLFYSNVYTRLTQPEQEIEGNWFRATLRGGRPTQYHVKQSKGFLPMSDSFSESPAAPAAAPADTAKTGSVQPLRDAPQSRRKGF